MVGLTIVFTVAAIIMVVGWLLLFAAVWCLHNQVDLYEELTTWAARLIVGSVAVAAISLLL